MKDAETTGWIREDNPGSSIWQLTVHSDNEWRTLISIYHRSGHDHYAWDVEHGLIAELHGRAPTLQGAQGDAIRAVTKAQGRLLARTDNLRRVRAMLTNAIPPSQQV